MMKPWEFLINEPADLLPFHDLLEEWGHPGAEVVKHLIKNKKFPSRVGYTLRGNWGVYWGWLLEEKDPGMARVLPIKYFCAPCGEDGENGEHTFFTATEAIWWVINAGKYKARKKKS